MPLDLVARLDAPGDYVWMSTPDGLSMPAPLFRHLTTLGGVYVPSKPRSLRFSHPAGAQAVTWLREHGYTVETTQGTERAPTRPGLLQCAVSSCGQAYKPSAAAVLARCAACGAEPLVLVSPPGG